MDKEIKHTEVVIVEYLTEPKINKEELIKKDGR